MKRLLALILIGGLVADPVTAAPWISTPPSSPPCTLTLYQNQAFSPIARWMHSLGWLSKDERHDIFSETHFDTPQRRPGLFARPVIVVWLVAAALLLPFTSRTPSPLAPVTTAYAQYSDQDRKVISAFRYGTPAEMAQAALELKAHPQDNWLWRFAESVNTSRSIEGVRLLIGVAETYPISESESFYNRLVFGSQDYSDDVLDAPERRAWRLQVLEAIQKKGGTGAAIALVNLYTHWNGPFHYPYPYIVGSGPRDWRGEFRSVFQSIRVDYDQIAEYLIGGDPYGRPPRTDVLKVDGKPHWDMQKVGEAILRVAQKTPARDWWRLKEMVDITGMTPTTPESRAAFYALHTDWANVTRQGTAAVPFLMDAWTEMDKIQPWNYGWSTRDSISAMLQSLVEISDPRALPVFLNVLRSDDVKYTDLRPLAGKGVLDLGSDDEIYEIFHPWAQKDSRVFIGKSHRVSYGQMLNLLNGTEHDRLNRVLVSHGFKPMLRETLYSWPMKIIGLVWLGLIATYGIFNLLHLIISRLRPEARPLPFWRPFYHDIYVWWKTNAVGEHTWLMAALLTYLGIIKLDYHWAAIDYYFSNTWGNPLAGMVELSIGMGLFAALPYYRYTFGAFFKILFYAMIYGHRLHQYARSPAVTPEDFFIIDVQPQHYGYSPKQLRTTEERLQAHPPTAVAPHVGSRLTTFIESKNPLERLYALVTLGRTGQREYLETVGTRMRDTELTICSIASDLLTHFRLTPQGWFWAWWLPLSSATAPKEWRLRAITELRRLGDPRTADILVAHSRSRSQEPDIVAEALRTLLALRLPAFSILLADSLLLTDLEHQGVDASVALLPADADTFRNFSSIPEAMPDLLNELHQAQAGEPMDAFRDSQLSEQHPVHFYAVASQGPKGLSAFNDAFYGKIGPLLATRQDGPVIAFTGHFYVVDEAYTGQGGGFHLTIRRMSEAEIRNAFGLVLLRDASGIPYEMPWYTLRHVIGRTSTWPGRFGWVETEDQPGSEIPLQNPGDLFQVFFKNQPLHFRPARLEVKGAGAHAFKSINRVYQPGTTTTVGVVLEHLQAHPTQKLRFTLLDEHRQPISGVGITHFLNMPGTLLGATYQPFFDSPPGWEDADQSQRDFGNQLAVRRNGVHLPNLPIYRFPMGANAITIRMAKRDNLRTTEMLQEFDEDPDQSLLGQWQREGLLHQYWLEFVRGVGSNVRGMYQSQLYMFPNGSVEEEHTQSADGYGTVVTQLYRRGQEMHNDPAYIMFRNNFSLNDHGNLADLAEYVPGAGTYTFGVFYYMYFLSRLGEELIQRGLLTPEETHGNAVLKTFLQGIGGTSFNTTLWDEALRVPASEVFALSEDAHGIFHMTFPIVTPDFPDLLRRLRQRDPAPSQSSTVPEKPTFHQWLEFIYQSFYRVFPQSLQRGSSAAIDQQLAFLRVLAENRVGWGRFGLPEQGPEAEMRDLFFALQEALILHQPQVHIGETSLPIEQAVEKYNNLREQLIPPATSPTTSTSYSWGAFAIGLMPDFSSHQPPSWRSLALSLTLVIAAKLLPKIAAWLWRTAKPAFHQIATAA